MPPTDTLLHGEQEERCFHGYYDGYCYLPLYVFCGRNLLVSYLRPSGIDPARRHAWAILPLLVKTLRAHWPQVEIVFRGDSGFCRWRMPRRCEAHGLRSIVGIAEAPPSAPGRRRRCLNGRRSPGHLLTIAECCPGTLTNLTGGGGKGEVYPKSAKPCLSHGSWAKCGRGNPDYRSEPKNGPISRTAHAILGLGAHQLATSDDDVTLWII